MHSHSKALNVQALGEAFAFGGEQARTQWTSTIWLGRVGPHQRARGPYGAGSSLSKQQTLRTEMIIDRKYCFSNLCDLLKNCREHSFS